MARLHIIASLNALLILPYTLSLGLPFAAEIQTVLRNSLSRLGAIEQGEIHYSEAPKTERPINLEQYSEDIVVRIWLQNAQLTNKILKKELGDIKYSKWGKSNVDESIDIQLRAEDLINLKRNVPEIRYEVIISDLAQKVWETYPKEIYAESVRGSLDYRYRITEEVVEETKLNPLSELFFKDYRPLETINAWMDIIKQSYPSLLTIEEIGRTQENRPYNIIHLSAPNDDTDHSDRKTVVLTGGVHAREWISVSSVLYAVYKLILYYENNPSQHGILSKLDFIFIPVSNPDGYEYTWTNDRLWRKNRQETSVAGCYGIDIDHSFDFHWTKSTDWACGEEYSGEFPLEATEAKLWTDYLNKTNNDHKIFGFIDLHSYAQEVLYPYAYSCNQQPRDEENLIELAFGIAKAIRLQSGKTYGVLPACIDKDSDLLPDLASGSALDFMYHEKAFWAYQLKLRDSGNHGFLLPSKYIEPVGEETVAALQYFCSFILSND
ncbi:uncharacterized protein PRCAT00005632001 [Priceomyces carsonii]|uniref:uncharacterized protein n=1 Tax=Priceomyces carsonii TaxID=28549 RepID=UPI002EDA1185|nr:unnamed protein product [Priceomyces carsonii]